MTDPECEIHSLDWRDVRVEIHYRSDWSPAYREVYGQPLSLLEVRSVEPERAPLPITDSGYRSHFTVAEEIESAGGPVLFVQSALDEAAEDPGWIECEAAARQMSLF